ncbi:hypothetical protein BaRGS_00026298, partial [Batillaria attramentaria]
QTGDVSVSSQTQQPINLACVHQDLTVDRGEKDLGRKRSSVKVTTPSAGEGYAKLTFPHRTIKPLPVSLEKLSEMNQRTGSCEPLCTSPPASVLFTDFDYFSYYESQLQTRRDSAESGRQGG